MRKRDSGGWEREKKELKKIKVMREEREKIIKNNKIYNIFVRTLLFLRRYCLHVPNFLTFRTPHESDFLVFDTPNKSALIFYFTAFVDTK